MISNLFKPAWKSNSADKRLNAVLAMDGSSSEDQEIIWQLCSDPEEAVCLAAVDKLAALPRLLELSQQHAQQKVRTKTLERFAELVRQNDVLDETGARELLNLNASCASILAAHAASQPVRSAAISEIKPDEQVEVLSQTPYTDVRQTIAEKLESLEQLENARKNLRGKDKNAERILKSRIDAIREEQRRQQEHEATVQRLIEEAEYLSSHDWLPEFKARVSANSAQWEQLTRPIEDEQRQKYDAAATIMRERFEQQRRIDETLESQQHLIEEIDSWWREIGAADLTALMQGIAGYSIRLDEYHLKWVELKAQTEPEPAVMTRYQNLTRALESAIRVFAQAAHGFEEQKASTSLDKAIQQLRWPEGLQAPVAMQQLINTLEEQKKTRAQAEKDKQARLDQLHKKVSSISRFAHAGHLGRARQVHERVQKALDDFSGRDRQRLEERLNAAGETLGKMGDWKNFATEPKYIELCEAMEALIGSDLHPDNQAGKIKQLQKQWKGLGYSDVSEKYWQRFKNASDQAYEPCAAFFADRREERHANLENRQQYVDQLQALLDDTDWENDPDYKAVQDELRKISDGFASVKGVERGAGGKQYKAFNKVRDSLYQKLDVAYDANIATKQRLVEQMSALAEREPADDNLDALKNLQMRWKQVGITRRKDDQKAWKQFKKLGDQVYDKVKGLRQEKRAQTDQQLDAYRDLIREIQALAKKSDDLASLDTGFDQLKTAYSALPPFPEKLPEKLTRGIERDYQSACNRIEERRNSILNKQHRKEIDALRRKAELCLRYESLGAEPDAEKLEKLDLEWQSIELNDHEMSRRIEARRKAASADVNRDEIAAERRLFCIRVEIATGKDSPEEDRGLRTRYQLDQMNESGLGQINLEGDGDLEKMEIDWLCMPGAESMEQAKLDERFQRILKA